MKSLTALAIVGLCAFALAEKNEEGFTTIFNGKDATGWVYGKAGANNVTAPYV